jgi:hypothetical protein
LNKKRYNDDKYDNYMNSNKKRKWLFASFIYDKNFINIKIN